MTKLTYYCKLNYLNKIKSTEHVSHTTLSISMTFYLSPKLLENVYDTIFIGYCCVLLSVLGVVDIGGTHLPFIIRSCAFWALPISYYYV